MNNRDEATLKYLEFNLIVMVERIRPHFKEGTDDIEIFEAANELLEEMKESMIQPTGITKTS